MLHCKLSFYYSTKLKKWIYIYFFNEEAFLEDSNVIFICFVRIVFYFEGSEDVSCFWNLFGVWNFIFQFQHRSLWKLETALFFYHGWIGRNRKRKRAFFSPQQNLRLKFMSQGLTLYVKFLQFDCILNLHLTVMLDDLSFSFLSTIFICLFIFSIFLDIPILWPKQKL